MLKILWCTRCLNAGLPYSLFTLGLVSCLLLQHAFSLGSWRLDNRVPPVLHTGQH